MNGSGKHPVRILILVMATVVIAGVLIARSYYGNINQSVDPRIVKARELYTRYDRYAQAGDFYLIFSLLDTIEMVYQEMAHYRGSFEMGVVENNRAAALLTIALYWDSIASENNPYHDMEPDTVALLAQTHALNAIHIYESWPLKYEGMSEQEIREVIRPEFESKNENGDLPAADRSRILSNRTREIETALRENSRRLSVCHTNLGVIYRYQGNHTGAVEAYETALTLWDRNLEAENNLNRILNRPLKKRNFIQKIFPPDREP